MAEGRRPGREWGILALTSLGAAVACLVVMPADDPTPWYLTAALATAVAVFLVALTMLLAQPLLRRRHPAPPP